MRLRLGNVLLLAMASLGGCYPHGRPASPSTQGSSTSDAKPAASTAAAGTVLFEVKGVRLKYPSDWQAKKNPEYELMLVTRGSNAEEPRITLDVPDLPPHLPFMIQMNRIEHDYLEDLRKEHPDLKVDEDASATMSNTIAKLVRSHWMKEQKPHDDVALLMIHASAVYILDLRSDEPQINNSRRAFESIRQSIQWTK